MIEEYLESLENLEPLSAEEEDILILKKCQGDINARQELIVRNLRLVFSIAKKYCRDKNYFPDLIGEGNIGLIFAVDRFDINHKNRFSSYAVWWIECFIKKFLNNNNLLRVNSYQKKLINLINEADEFHLQKKGRPASLIELSDYFKKKGFNYSIKKIMSIQNNYENYFSYFSSFDNFSNHKDSPPIEETIQDYREGDPLRVTEHKEIKEKLNNCLQYLSEKRARAIKFVFLEGMSQKEVSKKYGCSKANINELIKEGLKELRLYLKDTSF